jgi:mono/diheme cytochrome c family protein
MSVLPEQKPQANVFTVYRPYHQEELSMGNPRSLQLRPLLISLLSMHILAGLAGPSVSAQEYPPDLARGKAVYQRHCQSCHGASGYGDGPDAASVRVPPANFQRFRSFLKSDEELLRTIEHGVVFSPMHSWRGQLTDGEMQDVVAYIRLLSQQGR